MLFLNTHISEGSIKFDIYECPDCGKSELYRPHDLVARDEESTEVIVEKADRSVLKGRRGF